MTLVPLSIYIHIPWCEKKCPYCDFNSHTLPGEETPASMEKMYAAALQRDLRDCLVRYPHIKDEQICSIFIGGGTPSLMSPEFYTTILDFVNEEFDIQADLNTDSTDAMPGLTPSISKGGVEKGGVEITMEANPGSAEYSKFSAYREVGINRLSLGIQSFNDEMLRNLGRVHTARAAEDAFHAAVAAGFSRINLDIMFAVPKQSITEAMDDIKKAVALKPQHISWYQMTLEPNTLFAAYPPEGIPDDGSIEVMENKGFEILQQNGFNSYEVSAWTCNQKEGRAQHNLNYWQFGDYVGIGAGAHSKITMPNGRVLRERRIRQPNKYMISDDQVGGCRTLQQDDLVYEFMLNAMRLREGFTLELFSQRTGLPFECLLPGIKKAQELGLMESNNGQDNGWIVATDRGRRVLNDVILLFSASDVSDTS